MAGRKGFATALVAIALAACGPSPLPGNPALWRIDGPHGERGWLFGTIHALPRAVDWRTPRVTAAIDQSDQLLVEIAALNDAEAGAATFATLAQSGPQPPLSTKLPSALQPALARLFHRSGMTEAQFARVKTWAAALMLAQAADPDSAAEVSRGVDRALLRDNGGKPVAELEGTTRQLALFDALPQPAQRALLAAVVADADHAPTDAAALAEQWRKGDMAAIAQETWQGMLADPALRQMLYVQRNQAWAGAIVADLAAGRHPFVAVGAAHMAGPQGLPAMLAQRGFTVRRIE